MIKFEMQKGTANACAGGFYAVGTICTIVTTVKNVQVANETLRQLRGEEPKRKHSKKRHHRRPKREVVREKKMVPVENEDWDDEEEEQDE